MLGKLGKKFFGSRNDRIIKQYRKVVDEVNALEDQVSALSDDDLKAQTDKLKARLEAGESLQAVLPEAFATVREAGKRVLNMRHFDVQLIGGMVLNDGKIAEMRTGEGKTLVATLPAYLNALTGNGVHVITVNDYLARRDADWMGRLYNFLGMSVGVVVSEQSSDEKRQAYAADITYGTNNEYGFDYLRDNMAFEMNDKFQRGHAFAIIDEVDSILIDEARTPLIISGPADDSSDLYLKMNTLVPRLNKVEEEDGPGDFNVEEKWQVRPHKWAINPGKIYEQKEFLDVLYHCLAELPGRLAEAFMLREMDGLSTAELCKALDITATNSWVMLYRARMSLRRCLEDEWLGAEQ